VTAAGSSTDPLHVFSFDGSAIVTVGGYTPLQRAIMLVVGFADGAVEPFATCFGISQYLPLAVTAWLVVDGFVEEHADALTNGSCHIAVIRELGETDVELAPDVNVIVGGNDTGKSTLVEAIDLALTGRLRTTTASCRGG
jgi:hypothetical protein